MIIQFRNIVGQSGSVILLQRALSNGNFPKLTILAGYHGTGKSTTALLSAMSILCENPSQGEPCLGCGSCKQLQNAISKDIPTCNFMRVNMAEKNSRSDFGELVKEIFVLQPSAKKCVYVLEEMHAVKDEYLQTMLLERIDAMPPNVHIIMTTTELNKLITPLRSRARVFRFTRINQNESEALLTQWCANNYVRIPKEVSSLIIKSAGGVPRELINLAEFVSENSVTQEELINYLNLIDIDEIIELFTAFTEAQMTSSIIAADKMLKAHEKSTVVQQIKSFILEVIYLMEGNITGDFTKEQAAIVKEVFRNTALVQLASVGEKLNAYSSENDIKFAFLKMRQIMRNKSIKDIVGDDRKAATLQRKEANSVFKDKKAVAQAVSNATASLDKETFLESMNMFGGDN